MGGDKKPQHVVPAGTHVAILYEIMNLGTAVRMFQGKAKEYPETLVRFTFELPNERRPFTYTNDDGVEEEVEKPLVISREFTLSMGAKSNLRPFVEGIIGTRLEDEEARNFDLEDLIGKACLINVVHKRSHDGQRSFANIASTTPMLAGLEVPDQYNENRIRDINTMSLEQIERLPQFLQEKMRGSDEYRRRFVADDTPTIRPEEIPF
jgi:hypothetical protein